MGGIATVSIYLLAVAIVLIIICFVGESRHQKNKGGEQDNMPDSTQDTTTNSTTTEDA